MNKKNFFASLLSIIFIFLISCGGNDRNPNSLKLVDPPDEAKNVLLNSTFKWDDTAASGDTYTLTIATDREFTHQIFSQSGITTTTFDMPAEVLGYNTTYYWQVLTTTSESNLSTFETISTIGNLDSDFAGEGFIVDASAAGGDGEDMGQDVAISVINTATTSTTNSARDILQAGRIVVVGRSHNGSDEDLAVWRYNSDGTLDTSFNSTGYFIHHDAAGGNNCDRGTAVVIDSSDNIFVAGSSKNGSDNFDMVVWKIRTDGTLDTTFNGTGIFTEDNVAGGNYCDNGNAIILDSQGRIIVVGNSDNGGYRSSMVIWRLNPNGTLDTSFNGTGHFIHTIGDPSTMGCRADCVVLDSNGRMVVGGHCREDSETRCDMVVWRVNSNGTLDTSFNGTGFFRYDSGAPTSSYDKAADILLDKQGRIVVGGASTQVTPGDTDMTVWRLNSNGTLDTTFNGTGLFYYNGTADNDDKVNSLCIDNSGRIIAAGQSHNGSNGDMIVLRLNDNGTLDTLFATQGIFIHHDAAGGNECDRGLGVMLDNLQRIVVCGLSANGTNKDMVIWRLE